VNVALVGGGLDQVMRFTDTQARALGHRENPFNIEVMHEQANTRKSDQWGLMRASLDADSAVAPTDQVRA
jgi:hypothetical protein